MKKKMVLGLFLVSTSLQLAASQEGVNWFGAVAFGATVVAYKAQNLYANYKADASEEIIDYDMYVVKVQNCSKQSALSDKFAAVLQQGSQDDNDQEDSVSTGSDSAKNELGHLLISIVTTQKNHEIRLDQIESAGNNSVRHAVRRTSPSCHMNFGLENDSEIAAIFTNNTNNNSVDAIEKKITISSKNFNSKSNLSGSCGINSCFTSITS